LNKGGGSINALNVYVTEMGIGPVGFLIFGAGSLYSYLGIGQSRTLLGLEAGEREGNSM
jgi:hypothetical protein